MNQQVITQAYRFRFHLLTWLIGRMPVIANMHVHGGMKIVDCEGSLASDSIFNLRKNKDVVIEAIPNKAMALKFQRVVLAGTYGTVVLVMVVAVRLMLCLGRRR